LPPTKSEYGNYFSHYFKETRLFIYTFLSFFLIMNLISIFDLSHAEIAEIIEKGKELKRERKEGVSIFGETEAGV